ncbi:MAG: ADP-ribosylglycohydrolase family protein [Chloroflexi bacterium]|nr:ADP-ribosylglycohydrolase family protein [Chloroflexota bacterium]
MDDVARLATARLALEGLSVGDAFGERFFGKPSTVSGWLESGDLPPGLWQWTDGTAMALGVFEVLRDRSGVGADQLAEVFARNYARDPARGYGRGAHEVLGAIAAGEPWRTASRAVFDGTGSFGNGGAMRAAPIGGYFADDLEQCALAAIASAVPTHAHPDGIAGATAIAIAGALLASGRESGIRVSGADLLAQTAAHLPQGAVLDGLERAMALDGTTAPSEAGEILGSGQKISAADTVPFCLWIAAWHQASFTESMWATVSALGDRDTTCAIVGGLMALALGPGSVPDQWLDLREPLPV